MRFMTWIFGQITKMTVTSNIAVTETTETPTTTGGKAPRKALGVKKSRGVKGPARPYKKQETEALQGRITTMQRKIELLKSKTVILQDRLDLHVAEMGYRAAEEEANN